MILSQISQIKDLLCSELPSSSHLHQSKTRHLYHGPRATSWTSSPTPFPSVTRFQPYYFLAVSGTCQAHLCFRLLSFADPSSWYVYLPQVFMWLAPSLPSGFAQISLYERTSLIIWCKRTPPSPQLFSNPLQLLYSLGSTLSSVCTRMQAPQEYGLHPLCLPLYP